MTKVVVPYTEKHPEVLAALAGSDLQAFKVGDDDRYWKLLKKLWTKGEDFIIVEHDIVIRPDTISGFDECPEPWCVAPYPFAHRLCAGLGCVRFRKELLRDFPEIMDEVDKREHPRFPGKRNWRTLDSCIRELLWARGIERCWHDPVGHLGKHGCECGDHKLEPEGVSDSQWQHLERS
jgi:hypothetical protein